MLICQFTTLVLTEISQQLLCWMAMKLDRHLFLPEDETPDIHGAKKMKSCYAYVGDLVLFLWCHFCCFI